MLRKEFCNVIVCFIAVTGRHLVLTCVVANCSNGCMFLRMSMSLYNLYYMCFNSMRSITLLFLLLVVVMEEAW